MMSGTNQHPDLLGEMFVLESTDLLGEDTENQPPEN
jgi:hypothetical protein